MSLALIRLFLGGAFKNVVAWLSHRTIWQLALMVLAGLFAIQHYQLVASHHVAKRWENQFHAEHKAREADRAAYAKAQADAAALNKAQVANVEQQQQKVTADVETRYRADLARLRAEQLRPQAQRPASGSGASQASAAPSGPSSEAVPLSGPELLQAQETELQLNALIDWVMAQSEIDPNAH